MESTIITAVQLKNLTSLSENIDVELLNPHLLIAQQLYIAPVLGTALYDDIVKRFDAQTLTGDSLTLYEEYIVPAIGFSAWYSAAPFLAYKTTRAGIQTMSASDGANVALIPEEMAVYIGRVQNLKDFYCQRLNKYLIDDKYQKFPLFRSNETPVESNRGSSLYLGFKRRSRDCENDWQYGR
jgi:hypothetical protein